MNQVLEKFKQTLIEAWNNADKELHDAYVKFCEEHKSEKFNCGGMMVSASYYFHAKYAHNRHESDAIYYGANTSNREENEKTAEKFVKNLEERIIKVTGEIQEIKDYFTENGNGYKIHGEKGNAIALKIVAGGYNIVRLHIRNLIKKVK